MFLSLQKPVEQRYSTLLYDATGSDRVYGQVRTVSNTLLTVDWDDGARSKISALQVTLDGKNHVAYFTSHSRL